MSYQAKFTFTGDPVINKKADAKNPFFREIVKGEGRNKKRMLSLNFGVKASAMNMAFVEAFDSEQEVIKTMDVDNQKFDVDWADRFDEDVVSKVAHYKKYIVDLGETFGGRQEFITAYDMIQYLQENLPNYSGRVTVRGQFSRDWYAKKNTYYSKFRVQGVYAVAEDAKTPSRLKVTAELFYNRDCLDDSEWSDKKRLVLDAYIEQYINKDEGRKLVPFQTVFSGAKYDPDNERHQLLLNNRLGYLKPTEALDSDGNAVKVKGSRYVSQLWELVLVRGAEEEEFTIDMLSARQREQVELGIRTLEDFRPKGGVYGERIDEFRLRDAILENGYENGSLLVEDTADEFDARIYVPAADETVEQAKRSSKTESKKSEEKPPFDEDEDDEEDLF